jgi:hypothetical protein
MQAFEESGRTKPFANPRTGAPLRRAASQENRAVKFIVLISDN